MLQVYINWIVTHIVTEDLILSEVIYNFADAIKRIRNILSNNAT